MKTKEKKIKVMHGRASVDTTNTDEDGEIVQEECDCYVGTDGVPGALCFDITFRGEALLEENDGSTRVMFVVSEESAQCILDEIKGAI